MTRSALIVGVSGQDGSLIAKLLLEKGYRVVGTSRDAASNPFASLQRLGIKEYVETLTMNPQDSDAVFQTVRGLKPDEIYNLGAQSSVAKSFIEPLETVQSNVLGVVNLMEAMLSSNREIRMFNAGSGECFGDTKGEAADETTPFSPLSPYAEAKVAAHMLAVDYRTKHGLFIANGLTFNHESPLRPEHFVTRKITSAAVRISKGSGERLLLGNISIRRDWGWAPEYVEAMWRMLQEDEPDDYVLATGENNSLEAFVTEAFSNCGLDWREYVETDPSLLRPSEITSNRGDASKALEKLGWKATVRMKDVVRKMIEEEVKRV